MAERPSTNQRKTTSWLLFKWIFIFRSRKQKLICYFKVCFSNAQIFAVKQYCNCLEANTFFTKSLKSLKQTLTTIMVASCCCCFFSVDSIQGCGSSHMFLCFSFLQWCCFLQWLNYLFNSLRTWDLTWDLLVTWKEMTWFLLWWNQLLSWNKHMAGLYFLNPGLSTSATAGSKQPNRWVRPFLTQCWVIFNPAFFRVCYCRIIQLHKKSIN